jgi:heptosyltransferase-1
MSKRMSSPLLPDFDAQRICLIKPSALGDVVQTLPLLPVLRERFPRARISWVINRGLAGLLEGHPHLDEIVPFDRHGSWGSWWQTLKRLRAGRYDLVFDLQGLLRTGVMTWTTHASLRIGLESAREGAHRACHLTLPDTGRFVPAHQRYWQVAEAFGLGEHQRETIVAIPDAVRASARQRIASLRGRTLVIHPGARWITKRWPIEKFSVVACKAMREYGFSILILGSSAEKAVAAQLEELLCQLYPSGEVENLAGATTLKELAALLEAAHVVLTNDSGPMHLAAGMGTPVVGLFTCTSSVRSGPPGEMHELVTTEVSCAASYRKRCPHRGSRHMACLEELSTDRVWQAFVRLMRKQERTGQVA